MTWSSFSPLGDSTGTDSPSRRADSPPSPSILDITLRVYAASSADTEIQWSYNDGNPTTLAERSALLRAAIEALESAAGTIARRAARNDG